MPTKTLFVQEKKKKQETSLVRRMCTLQSRNFEAGRCTCAFQHMQSTLTSFQQEMLPGSVLFHFSLQNLSCGLLLE